MFDREVQKVREIRDHIDPRKPSPDAWGKIVHAGIVGNGLFPQAFLAQGIEIANAMAEQAKRERLPVWKFLDNDPSPLLLKSMLTQARDRAHAAYKITPGKSYVSRYADHVWHPDKSHAFEVLVNTAKVVYEDVHGVRPPTRRKGEKTPRHLLTAVQNDPAFQSILAWAAEGLNLEPVRDNSDVYKDASFYAKI